MFDSLLKILGWQGGTIHQAIAEVAKIKSENEILSKKLAISTEALNRIASRREFYSVIALKEMGEVK